MFKPARLRRLRPRKGHILWAIAWAFAYFAAARGILADPPTAAPHACAAASQADARSLADSLYEKGDYQRAAECYEAAGDLEHADRAFLKATGPKSEEAARDLKAQADAAQALFARVGQAFRGSH
jgi:tetratricopeptide (TPR) repeat protein